jgi:(E)-2-((N-methylformamido)methylene)succinate hydrolase
MTPRTLRLSDGASVRILEEGAGAPVLLIHGVGLRAEAWGPQMRLGAHMMAVDMPGHGESSPLPPTARLPDFVAWAVRVIEALDLGPVAVAGHSMGSLIAAGLAITRPDLVSRVALLNAVHRRTAEARAAVLGRAAEIAAGLGSIEAPLARWFTPDQHDIRETVASWLRGVSQTGYATAYRAFAEGDAVYADLFNTIRCPALMLTGDGDPNSTPAMTFTMAGMVQHGQAVVIPGHRHMLNLTAPRDVTTALSLWLVQEEVRA